MDEKMIRYRASIIAKKLGISADEAMKIATKEEKALKATRRKSKKLFKKPKKKNERTVYTVGGNVVDHVVSGGLPSLGKRK